MKKASGSVAPQQDGTSSALRPSCFATPEEKIRILSFQKYENLMQHLSFKFCNSFDAKAPPKAS